MKITQGDVPQNWALGYQYSNIKNFFKPSLGVYQQ